MDKTIIAQLEQNVSGNLLEGNSSQNNNQEATQHIENSVTPAILDSNNKAEYTHLFIAYNEANYNDIKAKLKPYNPVYDGTGWFIDSQFENEIKALGLIFTVIESEISLEEFRIQNDKLYLELKLKDELIEQATKFGLQNFDPDNPKISSAHETILKKDKVGQGFLAKLGHYRKTSKRIAEHDIAEQFKNIATQEPLPQNIIDEIVDELNKKHAIIHIEQTYILTIKPHSIFGGTDFSLESRSSFKMFYENSIVTLSNNTTKTKAEIWLKSPNRKTYTNIVFDPKSKLEVNGMYNIWQGFAIEEKQGDCGLYWAHVKENICNGNEIYYKHLRKWLAYVFQFPDEVHTAIVLCGVPGVGKNSFIAPLGFLFGPHYVELSSLTELTSNFNAHLKNAVLITANEALWGGHKKELGTLKAMITDKFCLIEGKGKDRIMYKNCKHVILISNEDWPVHLDRNDRRFFVLKVSEKHKDDYDYFNAIELQLKSDDNAGYKALLYDLRSEDLTNFNPRQFPHSVDAFPIKLKSESSIERYIYEALYESCFNIGRGPEGGWVRTLTKEFLYIDYSEWCIKNGEGKMSMKQFSTKLKELIPSITESRIGTEGPRPRSWVMPDIDIARKEFQEAFKASDEIWN